jgi:hypothetical protein
MAGKIIDEEKGENEMSNTMNLAFHNGKRNVAVVVDMDAPKVPHPINDPAKQKEVQVGKMVEHDGWTNIFQRFPPDPSSADYWPGWYPTFKHGLEVPGGDPPGEAGIMSKNEFYPLLKSIRDKVGQDFYKMVIYHLAKNGEHGINLTGIGSVRYSHCDHYQLIGNFPGTY